MSNDTKLADNVPDAIREVFEDVGGGLSAPAVRDYLCMEKQPSKSTVRKHLRAMVESGELVAVEEEDYTRGEALRWATVTNYYRPGDVPEDPEPPLTWDQVEGKEPIKDLGWAN
jgi:hypothetical protein